MSSDLNDAAAGHGSNKTSKHDPRQLISILGLEPHPEGGYFKETYRDPDSTSNTTIQNRSVSTLIYFLLTADDISHLHRIDAAEAWHHYAGDALEVIELAEAGPTVTQLGMDLMNGQRPQYVVAKDQWFGARVKSGGAWTLVGCSVAPGFEFTAFELAERNRLLREFPKCSEVIRALTKEKSEEEREEKQ